MIPTFTDAAARRPVYVDRPGRARVEAWLFSVRNGRAGVVLASGRFLSCRLTDLTLREA